MKKALIISVTSDIGSSIAIKLIERGFEVYGTVRQFNEGSDELKKLGVMIYHLDLNAITPDSICRLQNIQWNLMVICSGSMEPINSFLDLNDEEILDCLNVNLLMPLSLVRRLVRARGQHHKQIDEHKPHIVFFSGAGSAGTANNYFCYALSKIALIKAVELLDSEVSEVSFSILGPGWIKTKIHDQTLRAGKNAGSNLQRTEEKLNQLGLEGFDQINNYMLWVIQTGAECVSGRNIVCSTDPWGNSALEEELLTDKNLFKLRRYGDGFFKHD